MALTADERHKVAVQARELARKFHESHLDEIDDLIVDSVDGVAEPDEDDEGFNDFDEGLGIGYTNFAATLSRLIRNGGNVG